MPNRYDAVEFDMTKCSRCGICVTLCPLDCLRQTGDKAPYMKYLDCWYCGVCEIECPQKAVKIKMPYLVR